MSEVKLYTRRDLAKLATVGIVGAAAGGAGGVMRSMLGLRGGMMASGSERPPQPEPDYDVYSAVFVDIPTDGTYTLGNASLASAGVECYVDWGDGSAVETVAARLPHFYRAGSYIIKFWGGVFQYIIVLGDTCTFFRFVSRAVLSSAYIRSFNSNSPFGGVVYQGCPVEELDYSRGESTGIFKVSGQSGGTYRLKTVRCPKLVGVASNAFQDLDSITDIHFHATRGEVRAFKTSASSSGSAWNFGYTPIGATIHCSDGDIKYVDGTWTDV